MLKHSKSQQTLVTLANATELTRLIAQNVMGNDVADTMGGSPITRQALYQASTAQFQTAIQQKAGA